MKKRFLSLLLVLVLIMSLMPAALAVNADDAQPKTISVTFRLHTDTDEWIAPTEVSNLPEGTSVFTVFQKVLADKGYTYEYHEQYCYVQAITAPDGTRLAEFGKGKNSGWLFRVNNDFADVGMNDFVLMDGDEIEVLYTADYEKEPGMSLPYTDVSWDHWAYTAIKRMYTRGLMVGVNETTFAPSQEMSRAMLAASEKQYEQLKGTQWKDAALRSVVFFSVAASLQEPSIQLPDYAADMAAQECSAIYAASGIDISELTGDYLDYSQFKPRGYYEGDETLERYFRAMMWYGQINFTQKNDSLNRSALLMTLAMLDTDFDTWEKIYTVTSFFAGASDDLGYYEYEPAIEEAYGGIPGAYTLATDEKAYARFVELVGQMDPPAINSIPVWEGTEDIPELKKGFRFMGQRFTIDASVMQQLVYSAVDENSSGEKRLLPDTLDMPAALGSDTALDILTRQGETDYPGYSENMAQLRQSIRNAPEGLWSASLYASWLYTLNPLLEEKGAGYPSFMRSSEWQKKSLESYAGSFTELKHDTVLYSKQVMAEMGGGPQEKIDDRGYVEPETEVYRRFQELAQQTMDGLEGYGMLSADEKENLSRLEELAASLLTISEKELRGEVLTDEEYELIRAYGGTLEHLWDEAVKDKADSEWYGTQEMPSALVTDIATDPNGRVLQIATGRPSVIYVIVPVDGTLRLATGTVFDFYQFEQPLSDRMTDTEWRQRIGVWMSEEGTYNWNAVVEKPWWTASYRVEQDGYNAY